MKRPETQGISASILSYSNKGRVEKEPFQVIGKALEVTVKDDQNKKDIPAFWNELNHNGFIDS